MHQPVGFAGVGLGGAPVHRQEHGAGPDAVGDQHLRREAASPGAHQSPAAVLQAVAAGIARMHFQQRFRMLLAHAFHMDGAGHGVPVAEVAAHGEHQRIGGIGRFAQPQRLLGDQPRPAAGGGEAALGVKAGLAATGCGASGKGPLLGAVLGQQPVAEAAVVADTPGGDRGEFGVDLGAGAVAEGLGVTEAPADLSKHGPIGAGLARRRPEGRTEGDAPLRVGHHPRLLAPLGGRQHQVRHRFGLAAGIGLRQHHQRTARHGGPYPIERRQTHQRIGGRHPPQAQLATLHRFDLPPHIEARFCGNGASGQAPVALQFGAVGGIGHEAVAGQQGGEPARLPPAHGVGLAGE